MPFCVVKSSRSPVVRPEEMVTVAPVRLVLSTSVRVMDASMAAAEPFSV